MMRHLTAIGLSEFNSKKKVMRLINDIVKSPTRKHITKNVSGSNIVEYYKEYSEKIGIIVRGELNDQKELLINYFMPYLKGKENINVSNVQIESIDESLLYYIYTEDLSTGTDLTCCLKNVIDYKEYEEEGGYRVSKIQATGLSVEGKIILNVEKDSVDQALDDEDEAWRKELVKQAREGDIAAQELLAIEADEMDNIIEERLKEEDVFTILEGFFMPYGEEEGVYTVLGTITDCEEVTNTVTKETVYILSLDSIGIKFDVAINKKSLMGLPIIGMRFFGVCWMQADASFIV